MASAGTATYSPGLLSRWSYCTSPSGGWVSRPRPSNWARDSNHDPNGKHGRPDPADSRSRRTGHPRGISPGIHGRVHRMDRAVCSQGTAHGRGVGRMNRRKRDLHEPHNLHWAAKIFWAAMIGYTVMFINLW